MGPWQGGQAELLRVPWGDFNCLRLGEDAAEKADRLRDAGRHLPDRLPRHRAGRGAVPGDSVVIYGAGPVGLMAAYSATIKGAGKVMVVDRHPDRLRLAESDRRDRRRRLEGRPRRVRAGADDGPGRGPGL